MLRSRIRALTLSSLFPAFFFLKLAPAFFTFVPAFPALAPAFFFFVPEFSLLPSDVFPAISSVILFALPPAFLFHFAFCGADHSSKSFTSPRYFLEFKQAVKKAPTDMSWASKRMCLTFTVLQRLITLCIRHYQQLSTTCMCTHVYTLAHVRIGCRTFARHSRWISLVSIMDQNWGSSQQ